MLKVAVTGCGLIATKNHLPSFLKLKNKVKIVSVCDLNKQAAQRLADKFDIKKAYTDFSEMLLREHPDIVDICTPPQTHAGLTIQAITSGCDVLLEKPMALKISDCDAMIEAAAKHGKRICIMHNQIFNPAFIKARELVAKGAIGDFLSLRIFLSTPTDYITSKKEHWAHRLPGGILGETGPHGVYMALAYLENVYNVEVSARKLLSEYPWSSSEDFSIHLIAENGSASLSLIYGSNQWAANLDVIGSRGILKVDLQSRLVVKYNRPGLGLVSVAGSVFGMGWETLRTAAANGLKLILGRDYKAHAIGIRKFVESILKEKSAPVTAASGRETVRVMRMIIEKFNEQKRI